VEAIPEQRLHPLSWLFELFNVLRQFIVPILILLFTGQGDRYELWGLLGVGVMVPLAVARYYSFRYRIGRDRIVIRSGLLHKTVRDIAFTRIQNVTLHQGLLHRLMNVAEVRLETGGGEDKEEGRMRVLGFAEAQALQRIIRSSELPVSSVDAEAPAAEEQVLLQLPTRELLKLGLISNKGMLLVAAGIGGAYQFNWKLPQAVFENVGGWLMNHRDDLGNGPGAYVLGGMLVLLAAFTLLRLISILQAILHYHGFVLSATRCGWMPPPAATRSTNSWNRIGRWPRLPTTPALRRSLARCCQPAVGQWPNGFPCIRTHGNGGSRCRRFSCCRSARYACSGSVITGYCRCSAFRGCMCSRKSGRGTRAMPMPMV